MSATDSKEDLSSKADDKDANSGSNLVEMASPIEPALDGSGDHLPPSKEMSSDLHDTPKTSNEELGKSVQERTVISEKIEEIGSGDQNVDIASPSPKHIDVSEASSSASSSAEVTKDPSPVSSSAEDSVEPSPAPSSAEVSKAPSPAPSSLELSKEPSEASKPGSIEDIDSETQDDDLVLKWDDDDDDLEDPIILVPERCEEEVSEKSVTQTSNNMEKELLDEIDAQIADLDKNSQDNKKDSHITEIDLCKSDDELEKVGNNPVENENDTIASSNKDKNDSKDHDIKSTVEESNIVNVDIAANNTSETKSGINIVQDKNPEEMEAELLKDSPEKIEDPVVSKDINTSHTLDDSNEIIQLLSPETEDEDVLLGTDDGNTQIVVEGKEGSKPEETEHVEAMDIDTTNPEDNAIAQIDQTLEENVPKVSTLSIKDTDTSNMDVDNTKLDTTQEDELLGHDISNDIEPRDHGLNETNAMIEIPTQELIDMSSLTDSSDISIANVNITESAVEETSKEENTDEEKSTKAGDSVAINTENGNQDYELDSAIRAIVEPTGTAEDNITEILEENAFEHKVLEVENTEDNIADAKTIEDKIIEVENTEHNIIEAKNIEDKVTEVENTKDNLTDAEIIGDKDKEVENTEDNITDAKTIEDKIIEVENTEHNIIEAKTIEDKVTEVENTKDNLTDAEIIGDKDKEVENTEDNITDAKTIEDKMIEVENTEHNITEVKTIEDEVIEVENTKDNLTDAKPIGDKIIEVENTELNITEAKTIEHKVIEVQNTEDNIKEDKITEPAQVEVFHPKIRVKSLSSMINEPAKSFDIGSAKQNVIAEEAINIEVMNAEGNSAEGTTAERTTAERTTAEGVRAEGTTAEEGMGAEGASISKDDAVPSKDSVTIMEDAQPSTSQMAPDTSEDVGEAMDSLGLLAESSRVRDDDEEQETSEHDDDDDDFDPDDESSNQMAADQSEDSAQHSEVDTPKPGPSTESTQDSNNAQDLPTDSVTIKDTITHDSDGDNNLATINQDSNESVTAEIANEEVNITEDLENIQIKDITQDSLTQIESNDNEMSFEIGNAANEEKEIEGEGEIDIDDDIVCEEVEVSTENIEDVIDPEVSVDLIDIPETGLVVEIPQESEQPTDVDTVKISDNSDEEVPARARKDSASQVTKDSPSQPSKPDTQQSPSKMKKLEISQPRHVVNIVDLEESSSEDDVQVFQAGQNTTAPDSKAVVDITSQIKVTAGNSSDASAAPKTTVVIVTRPSISEAPTKPPTTDPAPATDKPADKDGKPACLEVFNLDSDEEEAAPAKAETPPAKDKPPLKCINNACTSDASDPLYKADCSTIAYYNSSTKKNCMVCGTCAYAVTERAQRLVEGIKNLTPLLELEMGRASQDLVEISDSESEDETEGDDENGDVIGEEKARMLERQLADMINATWAKFNLDARLKDTEIQLALDLDKLEKESAEVNQMLDECQIATDKLRGELYGTFEAPRRELQAMNIVDTPDASYSILEPYSKTITDTFLSKRRLSSSSASESAPKRAAIPLGFTDDKTDTKAKTQDSKTAPVQDNSKDDDKDVSVVRLSAEAAPASLPPPGELQRPPVYPGMAVYAMKNAFGSWLKARVVECTPKGNGQSFTMCRTRFENKAGTARSLYKWLPARCLAYPEPANVRMTIGTRVIALFKDVTAEKIMKRESYYSGIVAEVPNPVNKYRYLVFFDDGYAQYVQHADTRLVCEFSSLVWEEVHPFSREFVREYLLAYPERPMVRLHTGQSLKTEWNGKWWVSKVIQVDASLVQVYFEQDKRTEWIYRGSTRLAPLYLELQAAEKHRARPMPRNRMQTRVNMPYVEYTRSDEPDTAKAEAQIKEQQEEIRRQRAVAKKSTAAAQPPPTPNVDGLTSRVVYYTPKNAVRPHKMVTHTCSPACKRTDVLALSELRTYNPLAKPLLSAWERQIVRFKGHKEVMYRAPCGRRIRNVCELHRYLRTIQSDMGVDLFDFGPNTHCLAEFVLNKCIVGKKDLSHGKENVPVPCVNYYDDSLPEFCSYNTERTPTAGVPLNLDPEFLCGCDCTDDCQDKRKCACWKMTLEGARTIGLEGPNIGYSYKRLLEPLPSGIYECNSRCKCKSTCLNRVAQHPLQLKLQVFKTVNRGWGIRALNDVPKGAFLCIYAGNLLTDATANLDGLNEGDEYLAELDYIEVVEQMKEGYEDDIPEQDKKLDKKESGKKSESESEENTEEEEDGPSKDEIEDYDFRPVGYVPSGPTAFSKRLRKRDKAKIKKEKEEQQKKTAERNKEAGEDDCITISDDEELREPSRFAAQAGMGDAFVSKYKSVRSYFGKDEACYIMDAKVQGNIGRYLNHSCSPNVFVQNVFVDTHDPRFPWVAFFALSHIRAGTELTWNYNYDVGSVPGKALYCYCGAPNCRGRLL